MSSLEFTLTEDILVLHITVGTHVGVRKTEGGTRNTRPTFHCLDCGAIGHSEEEMLFMICSSECKNCQSLRGSHSKAPAVPLDGDCNTLLHTCPNDGNKWWQSNDFFHLWQRVRSQREWDGLVRGGYGSRHHDEDRESFF